MQKWTLGAIKRANAAAGFWGECSTWDVPTFRIVGDRVI